MMNLWINKKIVFI